MKIILFLNKDLEANISYNLLKPELIKHDVRIYYSDTVGSAKNRAEELVSLDYYEKEFFFNKLPRFINENKIENSFEFFDEHFKTFPIEKSPNVNSIEFINEMKDFNPDLFISIRFGKIFKDEIIQVPKYGLINLHSAILPDYRGIMGTLHAIKDKNNTIGCTLHTIPNSGIDTGEIIEIAELDVNWNRSLFWNIVQLYPVGAKLIIKALKDIEINIPLVTKKQNLQEGNYFSVPTKVDFDQVRTLEMEIISDEDYLDVLDRFVVKDFSMIEKDVLQSLLVKSSRNMLVAPV